MKISTGFPNKMEFFFFFLGNLTPQIPNNETICEIRSDLGSFEMIAINCKSNTIWYCKTNNETRFFIKMLKYVVQFQLLNFFFCVSAPSVYFMENFCLFHVKRIQNPNYSMEKKNNLRIVALNFIFVIASYFRSLCLFFLLLGAWFNNWKE